MKIVVSGSQASFDALSRSSVDIEWIKANDVTSFTDHKGADACFNLNEDAAEIEYPAGLTNIFINSVITPLYEINNNNLLRINGWPGFLERPVWEICGPAEKAEPILNALNKKVRPVKDEPGFIAARIISMIINEAYFAKGEDVSTEAEINIAMKLGTNYPRGPFEWADEIGREKIYKLLKKLSKTDLRYIPAPSFEKEFI